MPLFSSRYFAVRQWASSVSEPHRFKLDGDASFKRSGPRSAESSSSSLLPHAEGSSGMMLEFFPSPELGLASAYEPPSNMANAASTMLAPIVEEDRTGLSIAPHLAVKVQLRIADPRVWTAHERDYVSSAGFYPTERLCRGLLRRIEHCSEELITRKDSLALVQRDSRQRRKALRFELAFTIVRQPGGPWAERTFRSYQKQPLTEEFAIEIVHSMHRMVGMFLRRHDKAYRWTKEPVTDHCFGSLASVPLSLGDPLSLSCIPPSRFIESTQSFQFVPGYCIELAFTSRCRARTKRYEVTRTLKIKSGQDAPLTLARGENLLWDANRVVEDLLDRRKRDFDLEHELCDWLDGPAECEHFEEGEALRIDLRVTNSLAPSLKNLHRTTTTKLALFRHPDGEDCHSFLRDVQRDLSEARDKADAHIGRMNDFELRILEMRGPGWTAQRPARFCLDGGVSYSQRSIGAILDRVQTGVGDVLRGRKITIHMTAYKRGHLILDKALVARNEGPEPEPLGCDHPQAEKEVIISRLTGRIQRDLDRITKDTCSIDDLPEDEPMPSPPALIPGSASSSPPAASPEPQFDFDVVAKIIGEQVDSLSKPLPPALPRSFSLLPASQPASPPPASPPMVISNRFPASPPPSKPQRVFPLMPTRFGSSEPRTDVSSPTTVIHGDVSEAPRTPPAVEVTIDSAAPSPRICRTPRSPGHNYVISDEGITVLPPEDEATDQLSFYEEASSDEEDDEDDGATAPSAPEHRLSHESSCTSGTAPSASYYPTSIPPTGIGSEAADSTDVNVEPPAFKVRPDAKAKGPAEGSERQTTPTGRPVPNFDPRLLPRSDDESAPSTPALSFGGDPSPRGSMLITPTFARTLSEAGTPSEALSKNEAASVAIAEARSSQMIPKQLLSDSPTLRRRSLPISALSNSRDLDITLPSEDQAELEDGLASSRSPLLDPEDEFAQTKATFDFEDSRPHSSSSNVTVSQPVEVPVAELDVRQAPSNEPVIDAEATPSVDPKEEAEDEEPTLSSPVLTPSALNDTRRYPLLAEVQAAPEPLCAETHDALDPASAESHVAEEPTFGDSNVAPEPIMFGWLEHSSMPLSDLESDSGDDETEDKGQSQETEAEPDAGADFAPVLSPIPEEPPSAEPPFAPTMLSPILEEPRSASIQEAPRITEETACPGSPATKALLSAEDPEDAHAVSDCIEALPALQENENHRPAFEREETLVAGSDIEVPPAFQEKEISPSPCEQEEAPPGPERRVPLRPPKQDELAVAAECTEATGRMEAESAAGEDVLDPDLNVFDSEFGSNVGPPCDAAAIEEELTQQLRQKRSLPPLTPLLVSRDSVSSWEDYSSLCTRDSVDTTQSVIEERQQRDHQERTPLGSPRPPSPTRRKSIPTTGYLGLLLEETKKVEYGLRGALIGTHRFDHVDSSTYSHPSRPQSAATDATVRSPSHSLGDATTPTATTHSHSAAALKSPSSSSSSGSRLHIRKRAKSASRSSSRLKHQLGRPSSSSNAHPPRTRRSKSTSAAAELMARRGEEGSVEGQEEDAEDDDAGACREGRGMLPRFVTTFFGLRRN